MIFRRRCPRATLPWDHTPAESGPAGDHDVGHRGDRADIWGSSVEAYLAGGSTHLFDPTLCRRFSSGCCGRATGPTPS